MNLTNHLDSKVDEFGSWAYGTCKGRGYSYVGGYPEKPRLCVGEEGSGSQSGGYIVIRVCHDHPGIPQHGMGGKGFESYSGVKTVIWVCQLYKHCIEFLILCFMKPFFVFVTVSGRKIKTSGGTS